MASSRRFLAGLTGAALVVGGLATAPAAQANPAGTNLVISEVYGAGGNSGAVYNADFVELYNPTASDISLTGLSIHYRSASGSSGGSPYALSGTVAAGGHFLIQMSATGANGSALPTPDAVATPALSMAAAGGQTYLLNGTTPITATGDMAGNAAIVDMVGLATATSFETAPGPAASATQTANRAASGADTDNNAADLALAAPTPTAGGGGGGPTEPTVATIAEIQGTDTQVSPFLGEPVETTGVVTAVYPSGPSSLNGFYLQTAGTGGATDATPGASDGIFVFGSAAMAAAPTVGDYLEVTATVAEFGGETELVPGAGGVVDLAGDHDPVTALAAAYPTTEAGREAHEGELLAPTDDFVVSNNYTTNQYGEVGLATGGRQLWQPTDVADAQDTAAIAAAMADNAARGVVLDDGTSLNFFSAANQNTPLPWLTPANPVRIGSTATFHQPVVLSYRNNLWKLLPTAPVSGDGSGVVTFSDTRADNAAPVDVGGDITLGTFNVLNYFNTTGEDWVASGRGTCSYYNDRAGDPVSTNTCDVNGPRGAAESSGGGDLAAAEADLERQRVKIVQAINTMDADVLSLEEIENSVALGESDRDDALASLVDALNADAGTTRWAYAPSPAAEDLPALAEQDVIRTAFIYNPQAVELVGDSVVLTGDPVFANAREPLAQAFKRKGALTADAFLVVVNHFKSKGSGVDDGTGQGLANPDRIAQAEALVAFADEVAAARGTTKVFLTGDFNSYTREDPVQAIEAAGYTNLTSPDPDDTTYQFGGMAGSLDHVFANPDALAMVDGVDIWQINAEESVAFEYSRYNYNATLLYQPNQFRAADHNPEIVGLDAPFTTEDTLTDATVTPTSVTVDGGSVTIDSTVTGGSTTPTGTVEYWLGDTRLGESSLDEAGEASFTAGPFATTGDRTVEVRYLGDTTHNASSDTVTFEVVPGDTTVSVTADPGTVEVLSGTTTVTATVAAAGATPTGTVEFLVDGVTVGSGTLRADGTARAVIGPFTETGTVTVVASYLGNGTLPAATGSVDVTVTPAASTTRLSVSPGRVAVGSGRATATATVSSAYGAASGSIDFLVDGEVVATRPLAGGRATLRLGPFDAVGDVTVEARYAGTAVLAASTDVATLRVVKASPDLSVTAKPSVARVGRTPVTVSIAVASRGVEVTGTVTVTADGRTYEATLGRNGKATVTLKPFRSTGRERVLVVYGGDDLNEAASGSDVVTVVR